MKLTIVLRTDWPCLYWYISLFVMLIAMPILPSFKHRGYLRKSNRTCIARHIWASTLLRYAIRISIPLPLHPTGEARMDPLLFLINSSPSRHPLDGWAAAQDTREASGSVRRRIPMIWPLWTYSAARWLDLNRVAGRLIIGCSREFLPATWKCIGRWFQMVLKMRWGLWCDPIISYKWPLCTNKHKLVIRFTM